MWLASFVLAAVVAQAPPPPQEPAEPEPPPSVAPDTPKPLQELIVIAPPLEEDNPPVYDVFTGPGAQQFEAEAARKAQMRRYRDTGSLEDYPGLRCAVFNRC